MFLFKQNDVQNIFIFIFGEGGGQTQQNISSIYAGISFDDRHRVVVVLHIEKIYLYT